MLFWELLQCNKRFRSFIVDSKRSHDFIIICVFYAIEYKTDPTKQGVVRMCIFILQTMSVEPNFGRNLFKTFEGQDTLPQNIRIPNFHGTYGDFLITVSLLQAAQQKHTLTDPFIVDPLALNLSEGEVRRCLSCYAGCHKQRCGLRVPSFSLYLL